MAAYGRTLNNLPTEILELSLFYTMRDKSPLYLEYCIERYQHILLQDAVGITYDPSTGYERAFKKWQGRHLTDWICINSTCRQFRNVGKGIFFSAKTIAMTHMLPRLLQTVGLSPGLSPQDQALALRRIRRIAIVDNDTKSSTNMMKMPKILTSFSRLEMCTFVFRYIQEPMFKELMQALIKTDKNKDRESSVVQAPGCLRDLMVGMGVPRNLKLQVVVVPDSSWDEHWANMKANIYPILRFRVEVLAREREFLQLSS